MRLQHSERYGEKTRCAPFLDEMNRNEIDLGPCRFRSKPRCKFRNLLEEHRLGGEILEAVNLMVAVNHGEL